MSMKSPNLPANYSVRWERSINPCRQLRATTSVLLFCLTLLSAFVGRCQQINQTPLLNQPEEMERALEKRRNQQVAAAKASSAFRDFSFADRYSSSKLGLQ